MRRAIRRALGLAALAIAAVILLGTPAGARLWLAGIEDGTPPLHREQAAQAQAIVVLGGDRDRVHEAARLHALAGLPILLAGKGTGDWPFEAESEKMAWLLRTQHGIEPRWVEARSVNTHENAVESRCLLQPQGVERIVLVTHARHMARAGYEFRSVGFTVVADPIGEPAARPPLGAADFVPGPAGWQRVRGALAEYRDLVLAVVEDLATGQPECGTGASAG